MAVGRTRRIRRRPLTGSADTRAERARLKKSATAGTAGRRFGGRVRKAVTAVRRTAPKATSETVASSVSQAPKEPYTAEDRAGWAKRRYGIAKRWERGVATEKRRRAKPKAGPTKRHSAAASQARLRLAPKKTTKKPTKAKRQPFRFRKKGR